MKTSKTFNRLKSLLALAAIFAQPWPLYAQSIEAILQAPIFAATGGISASQIATFTPGDTAARNPYAMYLSGNMNFNFFWRGQPAALFCLYQPAAIKRYALTL
jgi:hypothetical protein